MFKKKGAPKNLRKRNLKENDEETEQVGGSDGQDLAQATSPNPDVIKRSFNEIKDRDQGPKDSIRSERSAMPSQFAGDAFHTNDIDTEISKDKQAIMERNLQRKAESNSSSDGSKVYQGQNAYKSFTSRDNLTVDQLKSASKRGTQGPLRAPAFVRSTTIFDYAPDVCKDYKETGFCGFGDSCKFLHDRSDFKSGWQQEREWDEIQKKKKRKIQSSANVTSELAAFANQSESENIEDIMKEHKARMDDNDDMKVVGHHERSYTKGMPSQMEQIESVKKGHKGDLSKLDSHDDEEELPFACNVCRKPFTSPVVTNCGHYFCAACVIRCSKCPICKKHTGGVFNVAHKIIAKCRSQGE